MAADARSFAAWLPSPAHQMIKLDSEALTDLRFWVDLRGQLSNPSARETVDLASGLVTRPPEVETACHLALRAARQPHIRDTVDVDELVRGFASGATIKELAARYAISESSVKRLLRGRGARRY